MSLAKVLIIGLIGSIATVSANAAGRSCKDDPQVIAQCEWLRGVVGASARGVRHIQLANQRSFVLEDEIYGDVLYLPGNYQAGEFEFCRFKDRIIDVVVDADGTTAPVEQQWGCINAVRDIVPEPDLKTQCAYAPHPQTCKTVGAKP